MAEPERNIPWSLSYAFSSIFDFADADNDLLCLEWAECSIEQLMKKLPIIGRGNRLLRMHRLDNLKDKKIKQEKNFGECHKNILLTLLFFRLIV